MPGTCQPPIGTGQGKEQGRSRYTGYDAPMPKPKTKRAKPGPKPRSTEEAVMYAFRLTPSEKKQLQAAADAASKPLGTWIRDTCMAALK